MEQPKEDRHFLDIQESLTLPNEAFGENFFRALKWGTLVGALPALFITLPIGLSGLFTGHPQVLIIGFLPVLISLAGTLTLMLAVQLPFTAVLQWFEVESALAHIVVGMLGGFAIPIAVVWLAFESLGGGLFFGIFGLIAGTAAGYVWGNWRESRLAPSEQPGFLQTFNPPPP